jgi:hypothetical protein
LSEDDVDTLTPDGSHNTTVFKAKRLLEDGTVEWYDGAGTEYVILGKDAIDDIEAKEAARNVRYLVDNDGKDVKGFGGFIFNLHRRIMKYRMKLMSKIHKYYEVMPSVKCVREYVTATIALELDANNEYHAIREWGEVVLSFKREGMTILYYSPGDWEEQLKELIP